MSLERIFQQYQTDAVDGNPEAQHILSQFYLTSSECPELNGDDKLHLARAWLRIAAHSVTEEKKNAGLKANIKLARESVIQQLNGKHKRRESIISYLFDSLNGTLSTHRETLAKAQQGNPHAQYEIARLLLASNPRCARSILYLCLNNKIKHDISKPLFLLGKIYEIQGKIRRAAHWYKAAAASGHPHACSNLMNIYLHKFDTQGDVKFAEEAIRWSERNYVLAAKKGNAHNQLTLAKQAIRQQDFSSAVDYLRGAARVLLEAHCLLGLIYADTENPLFNRTEANRCYYDISMRMNDESQTIPENIKALHKELETKVNHNIQKWKNFLEKRRLEARAEIEQYMPFINANPRLKEYFYAFHKRFKSFAEVFELLSTGMLQKIPTELDEQFKSILDLICGCIPGKFGALASIPVSLYGLKLNKKYQEFYDRIYHFFQSIEIDSFFIISKEKYINYLAMAVTLKHSQSILARENQPLSLGGVFGSMVKGKDIDTAIKEKATADASVLLQAIMQNTVKPDEESLQSFINIISKEHDGRISRIPNVSSLETKETEEHDFCAMKIASALEALKQELKQVEPSPTSASTARVLQLLPPVTETKAEPQKFVVDAAAEVAVDAAPVSTTPDSVLVSELPDAAPAFAR